MLVTNLTYLCVCGSVNVNPLWPWVSYSLSQHLKALYNLTTPSSGIQSLCVPKLSRYSVAKLLFPITLGGDSINGGDALTDIVPILITAPTITSSYTPTINQESIITVTIPSTISITNTVTVTSTNIVTVTSISDGSTAQDTTVTPDAREIVVMASTVLEDGWLKVVIVVAVT